MKKIIFVIFSVFLSAAAFAQRGIPRSGETSVSATIVIKSDTIIQKRGIQQMAELLGGYSDGYLIGGTYTAGYRFSDWFFLGAGVGYYYNRDNIRQIPIYVSFRGYIPKKRIRPYASLALGGFREEQYFWFANEWQVDWRLHCDFSVGVEIPVYKKINLIAGVGITQMGLPIKIGISF